MLSEISALTARLDSRQDTRKLRATTRELTRARPKNAGMNQPSWTNPPKLLANPRRAMLVGSFEPFEIKFELRSCERPFPPPHRTPLQLVRRKMRANAHE